MQAKDQAQPKAQQCEPHQGAEDGEDDASGNVDTTEASVLPTLIQKHQSNEQHQKCFTSTAIDGPATPYQAFVPSPNPLLRLK